MNTVIHPHTMVSLAVPCSGSFGISHSHTLLLHDKLPNFLYTMFSASHLKSIKKEHRAEELQENQRKIPVTSFSVVVGCHGFSSSSFL